MTIRADECRRLLNMRELWDVFPKEMRPFWLAQRERCPYCGHKIPLIRSPRNITASTWDHVFPRARWGSNSRSYVICHSACNTIKADRHPHPCEVMFRDFVNDIVADIVFGDKPQTVPQGELA